MTTDTIHKSDDMSLVGVRLSDGSMVHNVIVHCEGKDITIACEDAEHATELFELLERAAWITVDEPGRAAGFL